GCQVFGGKNALNLPVYRQIAKMMMKMVTKQRLQPALARRPKKRLTDDSRTLSAVLLPLYCRDGQHHIVFTKRTREMREHKGQIAFPGGVFQPADGSLLTTALRECAEEMGVAPEDVEVLGELDDTLTTTSSYIITPYVGLIPWPYPFRANPGEIDKIIEVPLPALLDESRLHVHQTETLAGQRVTAYSYYYRGEVIWGATAAILHQFLDIYRSLEG
ncbi:MAG: CoA pyrophosphatase, partial [Chloroflexota bacterium]